MSSNRKMRRSRLLLRSCKMLRQRLLMHVLHVHGVKLRHSTAHSRRRGRKTHELICLLLLRHLLVLRSSKLLLQEEIMMSGTRLRLKRMLFYSRKFL